jgi:hypothetical protein
MCWSGYRRVKASQKVSKRRQRDWLSLAILTSVEQTTTLLVFFKLQKHPRCVDRTSTITQLYQPHTGADELTT